MNAADVIEYARTQMGHVANGDLDAAYLSEVVSDLLALAEEQAATIAATPAGQCTCPFTDPATWTKYYGAVEPGSTQEYDPTCPTHGKLRERAERAEATIARVRALADGDHTHASHIPGTFREGHLCAMADLRAALDGDQP